VNYDDSFSIDVYLTRGLPGICIRQKKLDEVKACLMDVMEEEDKEAELDTTDMALEQAAAAYIDLLDLVREADETTAVQYKEVRELSAAQIREYRHELDQHRQAVSR